MYKVEQEYYDFLANPEKLPVTFVYGNCSYKGLSPASFEKISQSEVNIDGGIRHTTVFRFCGLEVTLVSALYAKYSAYDYTLYFTNDSSENSSVIRSLNAVDMTFRCHSARLKGIYGDYDYQYSPYDFDLTKEDVSFVSTRGRSCHTYFPYFNLEAENNGTIIALGWAGTWNASFSFDKTEEGVKVLSGGCNDLCTYLKPGETIRTPLVAMVRYYGANEDTAMNMWRHWFIDCNMPYDDSTKTKKVGNYAFYQCSFDLPDEVVFAAIPENYKNVRAGMDAAIAKGVKIDYRWFDAGWYADPSGNDAGDAWWDSVGAWTPVDTKWPGMTLKETTEYFKQTHGIKTMMWFEPERLSSLDAMKANHGYDPSWALSKDDINNIHLNNLGIKECLEWTYNKIKYVFETYGIDLYREDFNIDPAPFWVIADAKQGENRVGITENLCVQGHYALWDKILAFASNTGRPTFIDSCSSGGGRNDLETMRRAVPLLRSDLEGGAISLRLAMTTTFTKWIPYSGCLDKEAVGQVERGTIDEYTLRATMFQTILYSCRFSNNVVDSQIEAIKKFQQDREEYKKYFYSDFYVLTDYNRVNEDTKWTAYMYFDRGSDSGVISAFRQTNCDKDSCTVSVKGVDSDHYYNIRDIDGLNNFAKVKGSDLEASLTISALGARKALILYIEPIV